MIHFPVFNESLKWLKIVGTYRDFNLQQKVTTRQKNLFISVY